jgi:hypothetical protein
MLYYHQDIPIGTVISGTESGNGFYGKIVPKLFIHDEYNTAIIENILKRQKIVLKQVKKEKEAYGRTNIDGRAFVILDDCLYDNGWAREKMMRLLLTIHLFLENHTSIIEREFMKIMRVCFQHLKVFVKLWINALKIMNV